MNEGLSNVRLPGESSYLECDESARRANAAHKEASARILAVVIRGIARLTYVGKPGIAGRMNTENRL
jgi:hypothetical protein